MRLDDAPLTLAAAALAAGYAGYVVPVPADVAGLARRIRHEHVDLLESRIVLDAGAPAGLMLIARRGRTSRLAALGVSPALRGRGLARRLVAAAIDAAATRGDQRMVLEVIDSNHRALSLYEHLGFRRTRALTGYVRPAEIATPPGLVAPGPCPLEDAWRRLAAWAPANLPWQLAPETFAGAAPPLTGFVGEGGVALVDGSGARIRLAAFALRPGATRPHAGKPFLSELCAAWPDRDWHAPAVIPEPLGRSTLQAAGWTPDTLGQWEMSLDLAAAPSPVGDGGPR